jgi:hypothetical protein
VTDGDGHVIGLVTLAQVQQLLCNDAVPTTLEQAS